MNGNLLEEYDKVLARLENESWVTKAIVFEVLAIHDKERLDEIIAITIGNVVMVVFVIYIS